MARVDIGVKIQDHQVVLVFADDEDVEYIELGTEEADALAAAIAEAVTEILRSNL